MVNQKYVCTQGTISVIKSVYGIWLVRKQSQIGFLLREDLFSFMRTQYGQSYHPV